MSEDQAAGEAAQQRRLGWGPTGWTIRIVGALVTLAVLAVAVPAVRDHFRTDERDTDGIARQIEQTAAERGIPGARVTCPNPVEWRVGASFHCELAKGKQSVRVTVTMENDAGDTSWITE